MKHKNVSGLILSSAITLSAVSGLNVTAEDSLDIESLRDFLIGEKNIMISVSYDLNNDNKYNVFDFIILKHDLSNTEKNTIYVQNAAELQSALNNAQAGDEIILKSGNYTPAETGPKGANFWSSADGTAENPITIKSEDPNKPALLFGQNIENGVVLYITGDYWNIENLSVQNAQKGIILDNSNYSEISGCNVSETASEGIHLRDNSSYCTVKGCTVTNTGRKSPGYGEAIYVGSSESTQDYGHYCNNNVISDCVLGPGVTAELVDIKEYTDGTIVENCIMYGDDISGATSANAFLKTKGNNSIIRNNTAYQNGNTIIRNAFEVHEIVSEWGYNNEFLGNTCYLDNDSAYLVRVYSGSASALGDIRIPEGNLYEGTN